MVQSAPINSLLSTQVSKEQHERRQALIKQLNSLRFLLRQGLAIRGHDETEGNLYQLLLMCSAYDPCLTKWIRDKRYLSPLIINELITSMGLSVLRSLLTRCSLPLPMCRGQALDGASNMQGQRNGLATKIKRDVPAALSLHCLAHCLNLCLQDAGRKLTILRDALELVREIAKLIRFSPKRAHLFGKNLAE